VLAVEAKPVTGPGKADGLGGMFANYSSHSESESEEEGADLPGKQLSFAKLVADDSGSASEQEPQQEVNKIEKPSWMEVVNPTSSSLKFDQTKKWGKKQTQILPTGSKNTV